MFHANAWGLPYAAMMAGASLVMPDRFLQAEPLARMIETERVTGGGAVPTIWNDLLRYLDEHPSRHLLAARGRGRRVGLPAGADARRAGAARHHGHPRLGDDRDVPARDGGGRRRPRHEPARSTGATARPRAGSSPAVEARLVGPDGAEVPWDGESVGELEVRGPWITGSYYDNGSETEAERADAAAKFDDGWLRTGDVGSLTARRVPRR